MQPTSPVSVSDSSISTNNEDEDLFTQDSKKRKTIDDVPVKSVIIEEDSESCPICFEPWTSSGIHRLCCLKCGHLFGFECISKWLKAQGKVGKCPQCNSKAVKYDIRFLFCRNLKVVDTSERDRALAELDSERVMRRKAEMHIAELNIKYQMATAELTSLREELQRTALLTSAGANSSRYTDQVAAVSSGLENENSLEYAGIYELTKCIPLSNGNCRVIAPYGSLNVLCVSQPTTNPIFKGFGIRKLSLIERRAVKYIPLHTQPIRDMAIHEGQSDGLIATVGWDKTLKLTSLLIDQLVHTFDSPVPLWSCCWSSSHPQRLFAGCGNGSVLAFDLRMTSAPLANLTPSLSNQSPVISLSHLQPDTEHSLNFGGLLVGQLNKITFMEEMTTTSEILPMNCPGEIDELNPSSDSSRPDLGDHTISSSLPPQVSNMPLPASSSTNSLCFSSATTFTSTLGQFRCHPLACEGSLVSICHSTRYQHILVSYRPSPRAPRVRHQLTYLALASDSPQPSTGTPATTVIWNNVHSLIGGKRMKILARAKLFELPFSKDMAVISGDEESCGAIIWRCDTGSRLQTLQPPGVSVDSPVVDVCAVSLNPGSESPEHHLALLTERQVYLYSWRRTGT